MSHILASRINNLALKGKVRSKIFDFWRAKNAFAFLSMLVVKKHVSEVVELKKHTEHTHPLPEGRGMLFY